MTTVPATATPSTMTPGIIDGLDLRIGVGPRGAGPDDRVLVAQPGRALTDDGSLIVVGRPIATDPSAALALPVGQTLDVLLHCPADRREVGLDQRAIDLDLRLQPSGSAPPPHATRIAIIRRMTSSQLEVAPIHSGINGRRLAIGAPGSPLLVVEDGAVVAFGAVVVKPGAGTTEDDGCVVVGSGEGENVRLDRRGIAARTGGRPAELVLQPDGGETRFGGPIEGPDREPLTVVGGSDLSLGGGGVLMLGRSTGPNLVFDENEIMARDDGRQAPVTLQGDGGETRFGGPLRGPAGNPLRVVGGSDLSLGGQGVLMLGDAESHHLVLDENEVMAGNGSRAAELHIQWRGGGTSFGGPISGGTDGALDVQPNGGTTRFGGALEVHSGGRPAAWLGADGTGRLASRSDRASVTDPVEATGALDVARRLRPVTYRPPGSSERSGLGLIAEEVQKIAPNLVAAAADGTLGMRALDVAVLAIAAIGELDRRIDELEQTVAELQAGESPKEHAAQPSTAIDDHERAARPATPAT